VVIKSLPTASACSRSVDKFEHDNYQHLIIIFIEFHPMLPFFALGLPIFLVLEISEFMLAALRATQGGIKSSLIQFFLFFNRKFEIFLALNAGNDHIFHNRFFFNLLFKKLS
jgi:hypothetical protein